MNKKLEAGQRVAARLFPAENTIDDALVANASLVIATVTARRELQAPCGTNQGVLTELMAAGNLLVEARQKTVRAHAKFVQIRADEGMDELEFGCQRPCLESTQPAPEARLQIAS